MSFHHQKISMFFLGMSSLDRKTVLMQNFAVPFLIQLFVTVKSDHIFKTMIFVTFLEDMPIRIFLNFTLSDIFTGILYSSHPRMWYITLSLPLIHSVSKELHILYKL